MFYVQIIFKRNLEYNKRCIRKMEITNAYKAHKAVEMPVLMYSCNKTAHYRFSTAATFQRVHPEVVITDTRTQSM